MIVSYLPVTGTRPILSLGGSLTRYRPVMAVRITGPSDSRIRDGLLDTGADDTIFEDVLAPLIGVDLSQAKEKQVGLAGRPQPIRCRFAAVTLRITDGRNETYEWKAVVGFVSTRLNYNLLGHAGFLQYFDADFRGADYQVELTANRSLPGTPP